jgi:hypothetical protein
VTTGNGGRSVNRSEGFARKDSPWQDRRPDRRSPPSGSRRDPSRFRPHASEPASTNTRSAKVVRARPAAQSPRAGHQRAVGRQLASDAGRLPEKRLLGRVLLSRWRALSLTNLAVRAPGEVRSVARPPDLRGGCEGSHRRNARSRTARPDGCGATSRSGSSERPAKRRPAEQTGGKGSASREGRARLAVLTDSRL